jgi:hypothetical protein
MSLQTVFNKASAITINRRKMVGIQYTRSQIPKTSLTPTKNPWRFTITLPGMAWNTARPLIEVLDSLDRYLPETIQVGQNSNFAWLYAYQGAMSLFERSSLLISSFNGNQMTLTNLPSLASSAVLFARGDFIQVQGHPFPFTVVNDVLRGTDSTVTLTTHRPNILTDNVTGLGIVAGADCQIRVFCPDLPTYNLKPGAQSVVNGKLVNNAIVEWDAGLTFYEYLGDA